jgi:hypothetical protein
MRRSLLCLYLNILFSGEIYEKRRSYDWLSGPVIRLLSIRCPVFQIRVYVSPQYKPAFIRKVEEIDVYIKFRIYIALVYFTSRT